jgi:hypothetical protein
MTRRSPRRALPRSHQVSHDTSHERSQQVSHATACATGFPNVLPCSVTTSSHPGSWGGTLEPRCQIGSDVRRGPAGDTEGTRMRSTERVSVAVPKTAIARARETYPDTRYMSAGRLLRYALAKALGATDTEALAATRDARLLVPRASSNGRSPTA